MNTRRRTYNNSSSLTSNYILMESRYQFCKLYVTSDDGLTWDYRFNVYEDLSSHFDTSLRASNFLGVINSVSTDYMDILDIDNLNVVTYQPLNQSSDKSFNSYEDNSKARYSSVPCSYNPLNELYLLTNDIPISISSRWGVAYSNLTVTSSDSNRSIYKGFDNYDKIIPITVNGGMYTLALDSRYSNDSYTASLDIFESDKSGLFVNKIYSLDIPSSYYTGSSTEVVDFFTVSNFKSSNIPSGFVYSGVLNSNGGFILEIDLTKSSVEVNVRKITLPSSPYLSGNLRFLMISQEEIIILQYNTNRILGKYTINKNEYDPTFYLYSYCSIDLFSFSGLGYLTDLALIKTTGMEGDSSFLVTRDFTTFEESRITNYDHDAANTMAIIPIVSPEKLIY